tara:strand:- start:2941 stop:3600 length:660 start_codon:yes stop_codon:yes gene_type:complete
MSREIIFDNRDFEQLSFNVMKHKADVSLLSKFPSLAELPSFKTKIIFDRDILIRYIVLCYDRESPILKRFMQEEQLRKTTAATYAGWKPDKDGLFNEDVDDMMKGLNKEANNMIIDFVRLYNDPEWALLIIGLESYFTKLRSIMADDDRNSKRDTLQLEESRGKLFDQCKKMADSLHATAAKILSDTSPYLRRDFFCAIDSEAKNRLNITGERIFGVAK